MHTTILLLYLTQLMEHLRIILIIFANLMGILWLINFLMVTLGDKNDDFDKVVSSKSYKITFIVFTLLIIFIPANKFMYTITGLYVGTKLIEQPYTNSLLEKSYKILDKKLDEIINKDAQLEYNKE